MDFIIDIMDGDIFDGKHINCVNLIFYYIELFLFAYIRSTDESAMREEFERFYDSQSKHFCFLHLIRESQ